MESVLYRPPTVCRFGGEEFLIIFPLQTAREVQICMERCRLTIEKFKFNIHGDSIDVTVSVGSAEREPGMPQFVDLQKMADETLYAAKRADRNVIRIAEPSAKPLCPGERGVMNEKANFPLMAIHPPFDVDGLLKRCGGDLKFANAIKDQFRNTAGAEVARIESALAAKDSETRS